MKRYPVVFSAPQGWGKTAHAQALMRQYGCTSVVDNWTPDIPLVNGAIHMTNIQPTATLIRHLRTYEYKLIAQGWPVKRGVQSCV